MRKICDNATEVGVGVVLKERSIVRFDVSQIKEEISKTIFEERLKEAYDFFNLFPNSEVYEIINNLSVSNVERLCDAVHFYNYFNLVIDKRAYPLKSLLMIFVVEGATLNEEYIDFYPWLNNDSKHLDSLINKNRIELKEEMELLYEKYKKEYGSIRGFKSLFIRYLKFEEKKKLLQSFSYDNDNDPIYFCHDKNKKCCSDSNCYLSSNDSEIDKQVERLSDMLYKIRCDLAHNAKIGHFTFVPKEDYLDCLISTFNNKPIKIELSYDEFERLSKKIIYRKLRTKINN